MYFMDLRLHFPVVHDIVAQNPTQGTDCIVLSEVCPLNVHRGVSKTEHMCLSRALQVSKSNTVRGYSHVDALSSRDSYVGAGMDTLWFDCLEPHDTDGERWFQASKEDYNAEMQRCW